jgi:hypothetical protein
MMVRVTNKFLLNKSSPKACRLAHFRRSNCGIPVAEIRPVGREQSALARLVAQGRLTPATIDPSVLHVLPKEPLDGVSVADWLAADREQERW